MVAPTRYVAFTPTTTGGSHALGLGTWEEAGRVTEPGRESYELVLAEVRALREEVGELRRECQALADFRRRVLGAAEFVVEAESTPPPTPSEARSAVASASSDDRAA